MSLFWGHTIQSIVSPIDSALRISGRAQLMVQAVSWGCRQMVGTGVWLAQLASSLHVVSSPLLWSLHLGEFGFSHSMAARSIKSEPPSEPQGSFPAFPELVLKVT